MRQGLITDLEISERDVEASRAAVARHFALARDFSPRAPLVQINNIPAPELRCSDGRRFRINQADVDFAHRRLEEILSAKIALYKLEELEGIDLQNSMVLCYVLSARYNAGITCLSRVFESDYKAIKNGLRRIERRVSSGEIADPVKLVFPTKYRVEL